MVQSFHNVRPQRLKPSEQRPIRTISFPNPDQGNRLITQDPVVHEVLVFADDDGVLSSGSFPNRRVIGGLQTYIEDVGSLMILA